MPKNFDLLDFLKKTLTKGKKLKVSAKFCRVVVQNHVFCSQKLAQVGENSILGKKTHNSRKNSRFW